MTGYLSRLKALKSKKPSHEVLTKPSEPPFVSFGSELVGDSKEETQNIPPVTITPHIEKDTMPEYLWCNPYPQGTSEARAESLRIIEAARRGDLILKSSAAPYESPMSKRLRGNQQD